MHLSDYFRGYGDASTVQDKDFTVRPVSPGIATGSNDPLFDQGKDIFIECGKPDSENNLSIYQFICSD